MSSCVKCQKDTGGAKFCPVCGQLQPGEPTRKVASPSPFQKEKQTGKKDFFEQKIAEAAPKQVTKKKTWSQTNSGGDMYGTGKFKGKTVIEFDGPPPPAKSLSDLP